MLRCRIMQVLYVAEQAGQLPSIEVTSQCWAIVHEGCALTLQKEVVLTRRQCLRPDCAPPQ